MSRFPLPVPSQMPIRRGIELATTLVMAIVLGGCCRGGAVFNQPAKGATLTSPVTAEVIVQPPTSSMSISLDGADITAQFHPAANGNLTVSLNLPPGAHTLVANSNGQVFGQNCQITDTRPFTVQAPPPPPAGSVTLSPFTSTLVIERAKTASVPVSIGRTTPFTGSVSITTSGLPTGVTQTPLTIAAGATSGMLKFTAVATTSISFGTNPLTVTAAAVGMPAVGSDIKPLKMIVSRDVGAFTEVNPTPYLSTLPSNKTSLSGTFRVDISTGAPSVPQPRKAVFSKGTQQLGSEIGFTLGGTSNLGGAGFCADSGSPAPLTRGVVMSGNLPGFASDNVFMIVDLIGNPNIIRSLPVNATKTTPGYFFQPRVFFSHDCTLALVVGSNKIGPSNNDLQVIDLMTGNPIGADIQFNNTYSATVAIVNNQPTVQVTTDGAVTSMAIP